MGAVFGHNVEIVTQEIEAPKIAHPWIKFVGIRKDNPLFNDVLEVI